LWSIAENQLGSAARYTEILDLNSELLGMRPGFLTPGLVLTLPPAEPRAAALSSRDGTHDRLRSHHVHTVQAGETLASIAAHWLGSASRYPEILEASADIIQPGGHRLADADQVEPGWKVAIPPRSAPTPSRDGQVARARGTRPSWLNPGLERGGSLLAGALFELWQAQRRDQRRARRPGRTTALPPPEVWDTEQSVRLLGWAHRETLHCLDLHLRAMSARCREEGRDPPEVDALQLGALGLVLHLAAPAAPPPGWEAARSDRWLLRHGSPLPSDETPAAAAYPLLITLGVTVTGELWMVNAGSRAEVKVTGDPQRCADFARHVSLELATNPWARSVSVESNAVEADLNELRGDAAGPRPKRIRPVHVTSSEGSTRLVAPSGPDGRMRRHRQVELTSAGVARLDGSDLTLNAVGLSDAEAAACVAMLMQTRCVQDVAAPRARQTGSRWQQVVDQAGSALPAYTMPRPARLGGRPGPESLLPLPDRVYLGVAATTAEDLQRLAPCASSSARATMRAADPGLPADLRAWFDPTCPTPRLSLLGPAQVTASGTPLHRGEAYYAEVMAFLVLGEHGRTLHEVAETFALDRLRARNDLLVLREWLGDDPRTHTPYLTWNRWRGDQQVTEVAGRYRVDGALTDIDLFRRLRLRAQSQGCEGIEHLVTALSLVRGQPFADLPAGGWSWLTRERHVDQDIISAVVDVAHIVTTHALSVADQELARRANATARLAAPDDDVARWDEVAIEAACGHAGRAQELIALAPSGPSGQTAGGAPRTMAVRRQHGW